MMMKLSFEIPLLQRTTLLLNRPRLKRSELRLQLQLNPNPNPKLQLKLQLNPNCEPEPETTTETVCSVTDDQVRAIARLYNFKIIRGRYWGTSVEFGDDTECWFPHSCDDDQIGGCVKLDRDPQPGPKSKKARYVHMWNCFDCQ